MIIREKEMSRDLIENMRGGKGTVEILHKVPTDKIPHGRLIAEIILPVGASIGDHEHLKETEYYILTQGEGIVFDNGTEVHVKAGEVVVTPDGNSHSIENTGDEELKMIAVIILD